MTEAEKAADWYIERNPFTLAGLHKREVELIECAYEDAFLAGAKYAFERSYQIANGEFSSFDSSQSTDYRDAWYLCSRDIARAIRALSEEKE
jgi:hypothetical protein